MEVHAQQHREEMEALVRLIQFQTSKKDSNPSSHLPTFSAAIPPFTALNSTSELWPDYWSRFCTFVVANTMPDQCKAQAFLTNQMATIYKHLANLATQQNPPMDINKLTMEEIFMKEQFDPKCFIV